MVRRAGCGGFSFFEMAVVLAIMGVLLGLVLQFGNQYTTEQKAENTTRIIANIEVALSQYVLQHRALPCPSNLYADIHDTSFGRPAAPAGTCQGTPGLLGSAAPANGLAVGGVPTKALGLGDDEAFDAWNKRLVYMVPLACTTTGASNTGIASAACGNPAASGGMIIERASTAPTPITNQAITVLMSYGNNQHGAFGYYGNEPRAVRSVVSSDELQNSHLSAGGGVTPWDGILIQSPSVEGPTPDLYFDDILSYRTKSYYLYSMQALSATESALCEKMAAWFPTGQLTEAQAFCGTTQYANCAQDVLQMVLRLSSFCF